MGNTSSRIRLFKEMCLSISCTKMRRSSESEYLAAPATATKSMQGMMKKLTESGQCSTIKEETELQWSQQAEIEQCTTSIDEEIELSKNHWSQQAEIEQCITSIDEEIELSKNHWSQQSAKGTSIEQQIQHSKHLWSEQKESGQGSSTTVEQQIQHSKQHWSQQTEHGSDSIENEVAEVSNVTLFALLQANPTRGTFFNTFDELCQAGEVVMGPKFAEGGQAEIYELHVKWHDPSLRQYDLEYQRRYVLKVFKKGTFLQHLQSQLPQGVLEFHEELKKILQHKEPLPVKRVCNIMRGILLKDGRFGFLIEREEEDLRSLIDRNMALTTGYGDHGPFSKKIAIKIMYCIAQGMDWMHNRNIIHRDLKASNVLVGKVNHNIKIWTYYVADFECSIGIVGTGFFRAPEILQACKEQTVSQRPELFTKSADVYSYGMVCYEVLTGKLPLQGHPVSDYDLVINGQRPEVPRYIDGWIHKLLNMCWQADPALRPSFGEILSSLHDNSRIVRDLCRLGNRDINPVPW